MKVRARRLLLCLGIVILLVTAIWVSIQGDQRAFSQGSATLVDENKTFRIGYSEGDPFVNFAGHLFGLLKGLEELGWIESLEGLPYEPGQEDSQVMWEWLVENVNGGRLEFVSDAHYSFLLMGPDAEETVLRRLSGKRDLDLMIVMGTSAGRALSSNRHQVPIMVFSSTDPVLAGIVDSFEDSGRDHVWAHCEPGHYQRQVEVFYDLFQFERLGMIYEDSETGHIFCAATEIESMADRLDFELIRYYVDEPVDDADGERYFEEMLKAHAKIAEEVDAFLIAISAMDASWLPELLAPLYREKIPSLSQLRLAEYGAVMSVARADFIGIGLFGADTMTSILKGEEPRNMSQIFNNMLSISINLEAADRTNFQMPFEFLLVADEIYLTID